MSNKKDSTFELFGIVAFFAFCWWASVYQEAWGSLVMIIIGLVTIFIFYMMYSSDK